MNTQNIEYKYKKLSYKQCKDIYRETVMGKRVVEGLINFAMSVDREITIQSAPKEAVDEFIKVSNEMKQTEKIKQTLYNSRIYGTGGLLVNCLKKETKADGNIITKPDFRLKPTFETIKDYDLFFVVLDTLNLANAKIDTDILSPTFLQLIDININGHKLDNRFIAISHAIDTLYQDERTDKIPYAPPSVFYNMIDLLEDYDKAIQGLDALLYKSGCFIYQFPSKSKISGATYDAIKTSNYILEQKSNGSVISIQKDADIKDFPLSNINGLIEAVNKLEDAITKALNDTPASILFDRQLSNGFSNGDKDKETEIQIVNTFRQNKIKPLYELTDYYVMLKAWNEDFINEIKEKYTDLSKYSNIQLFKKWQDDFVFEFGNLYPEPESITIENNSKKLDNLLKLQQLGANASDIEAELNEDRIFKNDIDLDGQPQQFDNGEENTNIDYNLYKSIFGKSKKLTKYIDSNINVMIDEEPPEGHEWKTLKNGEHVLINSESGEIVSGIGGAKPNKSNKLKKGLDNSDNNNIISSVKKKLNEGDKDGRQQKQSNKQSETEREKRERKEKQERAINRIRKWMDSGGYNGDVSVIDKRRGDNSSQNGLVEYTITPKPEIKAIFEEGGMPTPSFNQLKKNDSKAIDTFKNAIAKAKQSLGDYGASVELKDDYTDINLYLSEDGESGFGIKPNGDIVSVFSNNKAEGGRSHYMLEMATAEGGRQLDCFDIYLTKIYEAHGFKPVAKMKWNDEYIPDGWNKENFKDYNNGEPDVVFMVYDPEGDIERKHKEHWNKYGDKYGDTEERYIPYVPEYDDGETFQHIHKWRSPAEREAIINDMMERYKNAKTTEELKKTVFKEDLDSSQRDQNNLNHLSKEQKEYIKAEYHKRVLELLKDENPEQYESFKKFLEERERQRAENLKNKQKTDAKIDLQNYIDRAIQTPFTQHAGFSLNDLLILADAKKEFDESKVKRDKFGRFARQSARSGEKNSSGDGNKDTDKIKDTDNKGTDDKSNDNQNNKDNNANDKKQDNTKNNNAGSEDTKKTKNNKTKDKNKSNNGLDFGDLPAELHEPFKRLNTATKPAEYIFNNDNERGLTLDDVIKISNNYKDPVDTTFCKISKFELRDEDGEYIYNDDGDIETVDLTNRDALKNDVEKFLYDFTSNSDKAKAEWGERFENEIKPQLKQMIKDSPVMKGKAYRVETFDGRREDIVEGGKINFDCRSVADDNKGYETVCNFSHEDYERGEEIIIFEFPPDTRGLNIQGCSVYPNEHEYLVDGDFIMEEVYKDEFDITVVKLVKADS